MGLEKNAGGERRLASSVHQVDRFVKIHVGGGELQCALEIDARTRQLLESPGEDQLSL